MARRLLVTKNRKIRLGPHRVCRASVAEEAEEEVLETEMALPNVN